MSDIIQRFDLLHHSCADDILLYIEKKDSFTDKLSHIESCVSEIKLWMEHNMLKQNGDKTELSITLIRLLDRMFMLVAHQWRLAQK